MKYTSYSIVVFIIIISIFNSCDNSQPGNNTPMVQAPAPVVEAPIEITAPQLYREYESNGIAFEQKYTNKVLLITGKIYDIDRNNQGVVYVGLETNYTYGFVSCFFSENYVSQIGQLKIGNKVSIKGKCNGVSVRPNSPIIIQLTDCSL